MIKTTIVYRHNLIDSIEVKGHAGSGPKGHDLVCAAVSAIITGGAGALPDGKYKAEFKPGYALIELNESDEECSKVLNTVRIQLITVQNSYPDFIKITEMDK